MKFTIWGQLPGLNEMIAANRRDRHAGAKLKKESQFLVEMAARRQLKHWKPSGPVFIRYIWVEPNKRRDKDNIAAGGRKIIQDALVTAKYLRNDGWNDITGFSDEFRVDKTEPRIEVEIIEEERP